MARRSPRRSRIAASVEIEQVDALKAHVSRRRRPIAFGSSPMMARAVTLLPQPDSPTSPSVTPRASSKFTVSTACVVWPRSPWKHDPQVCDLDKGGHCRSPAASSRAISRSMTERSVTPTRIAAARQESPE